jgi:hypothetical protein
MGISHHLIPAGRMVPVFCEEARPKRPAVASIRSQRPFGAKEKSPVVRQNLKRLV